MSDQKCSRIMCSAKLSLEGGDVAEWLTYKSLSELCEKYKLNNSENKQNKLDEFHKLYSFLVNLSEKFSDSRFEKNGYPFFSKEEFNKEIITDGRGGITDIKYILKIDWNVSLNCNYWPHPLHLLLEYLISEETKFVYIFEDGSLQEEILYPKL